MQIVKTFIYQDAVRLEVHDLAEPRRIVIMRLTGMGAINLASTLLTAGVGALNLERSGQGTPEPAAPEPGDGVEIFDLGGGRTL